MKIFLKFDLLIIESFYFIHNFEFCHAIIYRFTQSINSSNNQVFTRAHCYARHFVQFFQIYWIPFKHGVNQEFNGVKVLIVGFFLSTVSLAIGLLTVDFLTVDFLGGVFLETGFFMRLFKYKSYF